MKGNTRVIEHLNQVLKNELTAINQYFLHSKMFKDWGYNKLADYEYKESIDEMKHADQIIARILFLEGLPNVQDMNKVMIGEEPVECLNCDLKLEEKALEDLKNAIYDCEELKDFVLTIISKYSSNRTLNNLLGQSLLSLNSHKEGLSYIKKGAGFVQLSESGIELLNE